jgi:hypothetical protein
MTDRQTELRVQSEDCVTSSRARHNVCNSKYVQQVPPAEATVSSSRRYPQFGQQEGSLRCSEELCNTEKLAGCLVDWGESSLASRSTSQLKDHLSPITFVQQAGLALEPV